MSKNITRPRRATDWIQIRVTPAEKARIIKAAKAEGMSTAGWLLQAGLEKAGKEQQP